MGKATRWLRSLLGMEKAENREKVTNCGERREKKRWSFAKSGKDSGLSRPIADNIPAAANDTTTWLRCYEEQNAHAVAVAAATAAAADAAIVAAQAAVAVVRLTSQWNGATLFAVGREKRAEVAAVKIQTLFRGYLARKALRALKGVVKLQALVRGFLVRKLPVTTLPSIEALIRAQASIRARGAHRSTVSWRHDEKVAEYNYPCKRLPGFDDSPKIVEVDPGRAGSRSRRMNPCMHPYYADAYRCYNAISAPLPCPIRERRLLDYKFRTTQNTPRLACSGGGATPAAKNFGGDRLYKACANFNCPGYMANTQSYKAKLRSESAPRQRPECGPKKRLSLAQIIMTSRSSFTGV